MAEVVPHRADSMLDDTDFFKNSPSLYEREKGVPPFGSPTCKRGVLAAVEFPNRLVCYPYSIVNTIRAKFRYGDQSFHHSPQSVFSNMTWPIHVPLLETERSARRF